MFIVNALFGRKPRTTEPNTNTSTIVLDEQTLVESRVRLRARPEISEIKHIHGDIIINCEIEPYHLQELLSKKMCGLNIVLLVTNGNNHFGPLSHRPVQPEIPKRTGVSTETYIRRALTKPPDEYE